MRDYLVDTTFTRKQLDAMPRVVTDLVLVEHAGPDGKPLTVDVLESREVWIQYSRAHHVYRIAERKPGAVAAYSNDWRPAK